MSLWSRKPFVAIRILGEDGQYPSFEIRSPTHLFIPGADITWSAVFQPALPEDWDIGECTSLMPEEVRLFSAISLCEVNPWDNGMPIVTNKSFTHMPVSNSDYDLSSPASLHHLLSTVATITSESTPRIRPNHRGSESSPYDIRELGDKDDALNLLANIDCSDQLLLAGLARLLGAGRLLSSANEPEEAAISLFISMGAAIEFIRQSLCYQRGTASVPFSDVHTYLSSTYPSGNQIAEYFEEMYEHRVIATHPASRFGEFWAPPLMMGDVYALRKHLLVLYRHIALGERPQFGI